MGEPKLEIEQRLDRIELAMTTMAQRLVTHTEFSAQDAEEVERILQVEEKKEEPKVKDDDYV